MKDLRYDIEKIYKYLLNDNNSQEGKAAKAKASIEILQDIELKLNDYMKLIKFVHDYHYDYHLKVKTLVEARRSAKQQEVRNKKTEELRKKNEAMQAKLIAKENLRVKKFGKPTTARSSKPKYKVKEKKKVIDE